MCFSQPASYLEKVSSTPDLTQTDPRGHFGEGGKNYCAPVAVSNSLDWLSEHGYPKLLPRAKEPLLIKPAEAAQQGSLESQLDLARILSGSKYMDTQPQVGTEVDMMLLGLKKYILDQGYSIKRLAYQGFRSKDTQFDAGLRHPNVNWIKEGILGKSAVWLNLGWYKYKPESGTYVRGGGHWVTLVGYGVDEKNQPAQDILIIHNSSPLAGSSFHNDFIKLSYIKNGVLVSHRGLYGFPRPAIGFYKIISGLPQIPDYNCAILEGAVVLELY